jgi:hypothetical protein
MKKLSVIFLAGVLVLAFTLPASAEMDFKWGGLWRTRAHMNRQYSGTTDESADFTRLDNRLRLQMTFQFSDNLKIFNDIEWDAVAGSNVSGGRDTPVGTLDRDSLRWRVAYVEFNQGPTNHRVGLQDYALGNGFIFDDRFAGYRGVYISDQLRIPFIWIKNQEGGEGEFNFDKDVDYYATMPNFTFGKGRVEIPILYAYSKDASDAEVFDWYTGANQPVQLSGTYRNVNLYYVGVNGNYDFDMFSMYGAFIYNGGDFDNVVGGTPIKTDVGAWLFNIGAEGKLGPVGLFGEFTYATGDDNPNDTDFDGYMPLLGNGRGWSEIMGEGDLDVQASANSPGTRITNVWYVGGGADYNLTEALQVSCSLWYARLNDKEQTARPDESLGTEIDGKISYKLIENLKLDLYGAYMWASDGTYQAGYDGPTEQKDPYELGVRLQMSF